MQTEGIGLVINILVDVTLTLLTKEKYLSNGHNNYLYFWSNYIYINNYVNFTNGERWNNNTNINDRDRNNTTDNGTILDFNSKWEIHQGISYDKNNITESVQAVGKRWEYIKYGIPFELKTDF